MVLCLAMNPVTISLDRLVTTTLCAVAVGVHQRDTWKHSHVTTCLGEGGNGELYLHLPTVLAVYVDGTPCTERRQYCTPPHLAG